MTDAGHVVLVGAGVAALSTCSALRAGGYDGRLTLVGAETHLPYERPPLSKAVLTGTMAVDEVTLRPRSWYADNAIDVLLGSAAVSLDPDDATVGLGDGTRVRGDTVVLATGGTPRPFAPAGTLGDDGPVHLLRTREDAQRLRAALGPGVRVLIVGGGLIGAEVAASATARGCAVTLVDSHALPMEHVVGPVVADVLRSQHVEHGVGVHRAGVASLVRVGPGGPVRVELTTGVTVETDVLVVGIGITPSVDLAVAAGLDVDHGVLVDERQRTSHPNVYAVGDVARRTSPAGPLPPVEHWDGANRGGETAAREILGQDPAPPRAPWFWSDRYGVRLEMVGHRHAGATTVTRGRPDDGGLSVFEVLDGRCVGAVAVGRGADVRAAQRLIDRRIAVDPARLGDESVDLRSLVRG